MKTSILSTCFLLFVTAAMAQTGTITGTILKNEKPAEGATITLLRGKDSATVKLSAASKEGAFSFENIQYGKYLLSVTAVGSKKAWSSSIELSSTTSTVQVPAINLVSVSKDLGDVTVTAKRPLIEQKIDRTVLN